MCVWVNWPAPVPSPRLAHTVTEMAATASHRVASNMVAVTTHSPAGVHHYTAGAVLPHPVNPVAPGSAIAPIACICLLSLTTVGMTVLGFTVLDVAEVTQIPRDLDMRENLEVEMPVLLSAWRHMYSASSVIIIREKDTKVGERHEPNNPWQRGPHVESRCAGVHPRGDLSPGPPTPLLPAATALLGGGSFAPPLPLSFGPDCPKRPKIRRC